MPLMGVASVLREFRMETSYNQSIAQNQGMWNYLKNAMVKSIYFDSMTVTVRTVSLCLLGTMFFAASAKEILSD